MSVEYFSSVKRLRVGQYDVDVRVSLSARPAPTMLLVHGIGVSGRYFMPFAEACAQEYNVHVVDMPGYGKTPKPERPLSLEQMSGIAADYIRSNGISPVIVVGQSMGCQIVLHLARRYPELCSKLILIGPTVNRAERSLPKQGLRLFQDMFMEPLRVQRVAFGDYVRMGVFRYFRTVRYMLDDCPEDCAKEADVEMLIIRGGKDKIVPRGWTEYLSGRAPRSQTREIPDAPHLVHYVKPQEVFIACQDFLGA